MKGTLMLMALAVLLTAGAQAEDDYAIRVYPVPRLVGTLDLDGRLDDAAWEQAPLVSGFTWLGSTELADVQTAFRVLYDDEYLYFGIHCDEPNMEHLTPVRFPRDEHAIFRTETLEVFVDPDHTHNLYYQLAFNAAGSLYDGERENTVWNSEAEVATHLGEDYWSVELAVPWRTLGGEAAEGRMLGFNVARNRHLRTAREHMTWTRLRGGFHDPVRFAHLVLSGTPEMIGGLAAEFRKGQRTGPIHVYSAEGFSNQSYRELAAAGLTELDELIAGLEAQQKSEQDPGAAAELARRLQQYKERMAAFRQRAEAPDGAAWSRLDVDMQALRLELARVVWEARLEALLRSL